MDKNTNLWNEDRIIKSVPEQLLEEENNPYIGKSNKNFKDMKPKCFNCNKYRHMAKECRLEKKEQETQIYFKCNKKEHIAKDCRGKQVMKKQKV